MKVQKFKKIHWSFPAVHIRFTCQPYMLSGGKSPPPHPGGRRWSGDGPANGAGPRGSTGGPRGPPCRKLGIGGTGTPGPYGSKRAPGGTPGGKKPGPRPGPNRGPSVGSHSPPPPNIGCSGPSRPPAPAPPPGSRSPSKSPEGKCSGPRLVVEPGLLARPGARGCVGAGIGEERWSRLPAGADGVD